MCDHANGYSSLVHYVEALSSPLPNRDHTQPIVVVMILAPESIVHDNASSTLVERNQVAAEAQSFQTCVLYELILLVVYPIHGRS